jgi:hypothetical protein
MHLVIAQSADALDAARSWGDQLPALGLGLLGFGILVWLFLRRLKEMGEESRAERESRDSLFSKTIAEVSERSEAQAERCHQVQAEAVSTIRENSEAIGSVKSALERSMTVTQDLSQVLAAARAEIQARRLTSLRTARASAR